MKIICISDTHCQLDKIILPDGDLLIHAGDATYKGNEKEISIFNQQLGNIKHKYKNGIIFIPGNHDWLFQTNEKLARDIMTNCHVLIDQSVEIEGKIIYGSPWQPEFCNWAFNVPRNKISKKWDLIPNKVDVLITHGPVQGILDECPDGFKAGCEELYKKVLEVKPEFHICGHIHHSYGMINFNSTTFINASICDESYSTTNKPIIIEI